MQNEPFSTYVPGVCCRHDWKAVDKPIQGDDGVERESDASFLRRMRRWQEVNEYQCAECGATCIRDSSGRIAEYDLMPYLEVEEMGSRKREQRA